MIEVFDKDMFEIPARKFKALGHPIRLWIAQQLLYGEHCVHEFVDKIGCEFSTISQHLTALKSAEVLMAEKRGKEIYYSIKCDCIRKFLVCIAERQRAGKCGTEKNKVKSKERK